MKRSIENSLDEWRRKDHRKPLLIRGARQVGKTYSVREFGKGFKSYAEINFELLKNAREIFEPDLMPDRIIRDLSLLMHTKIIPGETLLFLDEIQEAPEALTALRYFYERLPELHVVAAGSLLEFQIEEIGIPVGRIATLYMHPFSFSEFLTAAGEEDYFPVIADVFRKGIINKALHDRLMRLLGEYIAIGGMPESVSRWIETKDYRECRSVHRNLIETYRQDFGKYAKKYQIKYVERIFNETPRLLGRKFKFSAISGGWRKRELSPALELLEKAGVLHKIHHTSGHGLPLGAGVDFNRYKLLFLDIALSQALLDMDMTSWILSPLKEFINRGVVAEALVGQELVAGSDIDMKKGLYYWHRESRSSNAEVDYLVARNNRIIPVEVKSGKEGTLKSMRLFLEQHPDSPYGIRLYSGTPNEVDHIRSYPLYCAMGLTGMFE